MNYKILDREFRDYTKELKYPFSDEAVMGSSDGLPLASDVFLDIIVYSAEEVELPFYLSSIRQTTSSFVIEISDSGGRSVAEAVIDDDTDLDNATLYKDGLEAGSIVYDLLLINQLRSIATQGPLLFGNNLPILVSRCHVYKTQHMTGVRTPDGSVRRGSVFIVAAGGVSFGEDDHGNKTLNLYGEDPSDRLVREINGIKREQYWFAAHPNSGIKIETISNGLKFRSIIDE